LKRLPVLSLLILLVSAGLEAQTPQATEMPGDIFTIKKTWTIGGEGNWDYLTLDPVGLRLYIAHGTAVQVVDVNAGSLIGQVTGLRDAHQIALDPESQYAYVSDGPANEVKVFDRESLEIVASIPTGKNPRALVFDPASRLVFAVCPDTATAESKTPRRTASGQTIRQPSSSNVGSLVHSTVTIIDADTRTRLADLLLPGKLGFAQTDGKGTVFVNITDRNQIAYLHALGIESRLRQLADAATPDPSKTASASADDPALLVDWSDSAVETQPLPRALHVFRLNDCQSPKSLAADSVNSRLFVACDNMKMQVLNATNGDVIATLPIGAGTDAVGYDPDHGLIYAANGGGVGSLTVIRQHLSDSYAVIQELPTRARARTLAVNPTTGEVYLVTNIRGLDRAQNGGIGGLRTAPVEGSFQVLVVGN
jgi:YVTN family beta-propeller protein